MPRPVVAFTFEQGVGCEWIGGEGGTVFCGVYTNDYEEGGIAAVYNLIV